MTYANKFGETSGKCICFVTSYTVDCIANYAFSNSSIKCRFGVTISFTAL